MRPTRRPRPTARVVIAVLLLAACAAPAALAQNRLFLAEYAFNNPLLTSMFRDGTGVTALTPPPPADWLQVGLDYDPAAARLYWTHGSTPGVIRRADADGSNPVLLVPGLKLPRGIAVDRLNGKMYWSEAPPQGNAMGLIRRANLDGTGVETVYTLTPYDPISSYVGKPVVDPVNGYVYFAAANEIRRAPLDGSGPVQTVVRGFNTATALALDVAADRVYFLDANTNSDVLGYASLDDSEFAVVFDNSPGVFGSSGLFALELDVAGQKAYFTDEIQGTLRRVNLDGSGLELLYTSQPTHSPTGLTLDDDTLQPIQDCNANLVRDLDDIRNGTSADCNVNGIPDECENDPCTPVDWAVDTGSNPVPNGRVLSGNPTSGFEVFQPFNFTRPGAPGAQFVRIGLDGWTMNYHPNGFRATIFPDDGSGQRPDETRPLASADVQYRFSPNTTAWEYRPLSVFLVSGRYYVRLTALDPHYEASVNVGTSGEASFSRRLSNGSIVFATTSIALRLEAAGAAAVPESGAGVTPRLAAVRPNPTRGGAAIAWSLPAAARLSIAIVDPAGRVVRTLRAGPHAVGAGELAWDGRNAAGRPVAAGTYFVRLAATAADGRVTTATERLVVLR
jgi:hypothetical protein